VNNGAEDEETARDLWPKQRFFAVVVDREDPDLVPKYYGIGKKNYFQLVDKLHEEDYKDYMDPLCGLDVNVKCQKEMGENGKPQRYPTTTFTWRRKESRVADSDEKIREIVSQIKRIDEVFKPMTTAEIRGRLDEWLKWKDGDEADGGEETRGAVAKEEGSDLSLDKEESKEPVSAESIHAEFEKALQEAEASA
jgi:hypothetical protein